MKKAYEMFDGNYKARKRINLGNKKKETAEDLYKRVREERAERQRLKEETHAALTVQALFRRRRDTAQARAAVEADLDATLRGTPQGTVLPLGALRRLLAQYNFLERTRKDTAEFDVQRGVKVAVLVASCIRAGPASSELLRALLASSASVARPLSECGGDDTLEFFQTTRLCANLFGLVGSKSLFVARFAPLAKLVLWVVQSFVTPRMVGSETLARNLSSAMLSAFRGNLLSCVVRRYVDNAVSAGTWPVADMVSAILCELAASEDNVATFTTPFVFDFAVKYDPKVTEKLGLNVHSQVSKLLAQGDPAVYAKRVNRKNYRAFLGLVMNSSSTEAPEDHSKEVFRLLEVLLSKYEKACPARYVLKGLFQGSVRDPAVREHLFEQIAQRVEKEEDEENSEGTFVLNRLLNAAMCVVMREDAEDELYEQHSYASADTSNFDNGEGLSTTLLTEFVGHPALFSIIWHKLLHKQCSNEAHSRGTGSVLTLECARLLWLWVRAAEARVGAMSDTEFYGDGVPCGRVLSDAALSDAISILSYIVWKLFSETSSSFPSTSYFYSSSSSSALHISNRLREGLRRAGARLLRVLYDKNCRRGFCADNAWVVPMASAPSPSSSATGAVMQEIPFVTPFSVRVGTLRAAIASDRARIRAGGDWESFDLYVTRDSATEDTRAAFLEHGPSGALRKSLRVEFVGEEGVDGGGLRKELLGLVARDVFGPDRGLFVATAADGALYPSPDLGIIDKHRLDDYRFAGVLVGVCIVNSVLVDIPFARFFLERMRGSSNSNSSSNSRRKGEEEEEERVTSTVSELATLDPEFARQLTSLRGMTPEDVADLDLTFTIDSVSAKTGAVRTFELAPGGAGVPVTAENRLWYIAAVANFRLNVEIAVQSKAFFEGLECVFPRERLHMFSPDELQRLVSGARGPIDIADWRANTEYQRGYTDDSQTICWFWEVVAELSPQDQAALLHFCTSCSRPPLLGFAHLKPRFGIIKETGGEDGAANRLPTASTCVNLLRLPEVQSKEQMRKNMSIIVQFPTGFQFG